jgi:hypothetical protein
MVGVDETLEIQHLMAGPSRMPADYLSFFSQGNIYMQRFGVRKNPERKI